MPVGAEKRILLEALWVAWSEHGLRNRTPALRDTHHAVERLIDLEQA